MIWTAWLGIQGTYAEWLGVWGSVASLVSLAALPFSVYGALKIRAVARRLLFNARAEDIVRDIRGRVDRVTEQVSAPPIEWLSLDIELRLCVEAVYRTERSISGHARKRINEITRLHKIYKRRRRRNVKSFESDPVPFEVWEIITEIRVFLGDMDHLLADRRLGGADVE